MTHNPSDEQIQMLQKSCRDINPVKKLNQGTNYLENTFEAIYC